MDIGIDNPVGRVPDSRTMAVTTLSLTSQGWRLGRRRGSGGAALLDRLRDLDNVHELRVSGVGAEGTAPETAEFLQAAIARGTFVSGDLGALVRDALPVALRAAIRPPSTSVAGDLEWDIASVVQRRAALRPLMPTVPAVSLVLVSRRAELVNGMVERLARLDYPSLEIVVGLHGVEAPAGLAQAAGDRELVVRTFDASEEASLLKEIATVRLTPRGVKHLAERNAASAASLEESGQEDCAGKIEAQISIESIGQAAELFISLGSEIEVLAPPALRQRLAEEGARLTKLYSDWSTDQTS